jgi:hypothetical protein
MRIGIIVIGAVCAISAALVSVHLFLDPDPELLTFVSDDGRMVLTGTVYRAEEFELLTEAGAVTYPSLSSARYILTPKDALFSEPLVATLPRDSSRVLYAFDETAGYAIPLQAQKDADGNSSFFVTHGGEYALGEEIMVDAPLFVDVVSEMRSRLPERAVSYALYVVAAPQGDVPVLLPVVLEEGGCGGLPTKGDTFVRSEDQRVAQVLVNDVLTETIFTFLMDIRLTSEGCPEDMPLQVIF